MQAASIASSQGAQPSHTIKRTRKKKTKSVSLGLGLLSPVLKAMACALRNHLPTHPPAAGPRA